jgi:hypothetical protein
MQKKQKKVKSIVVDVVMHDRKPDEKLPEVAMYLISPAGAVLKKLAVVKKGKLELLDEWKDLGLVVGLGPDVDELQTFRIKSLQQYRLDEVWPQWEKQKVIVVTRERWTKWFMQYVCVSGIARKCFPFIYSPFDIPTPSPTESLALPETLPFPFPICRSLCNGVVEIYEQTCCYALPEIDDTFDDRIPWEVVCEKLGPYCPGFPPDMGLERFPLDRSSLRKIKLTQALIDPAKVVPPSARLIRDVRVLKELSRAEAIEYIKARPYLISMLANCTSRKVGEAILGPDGSFTFCYWRMNLPIVSGTTCTVTYAYKVKQWQENQWVYVYDGIASHEYFSSDEIADLTTYNPLARPCETAPPPFPYPKPFVLLQDIGSTSSYHLVSPAQTEANGINSTLSANSGLVFPPPAGRTAVWQAGDIRPYNCPWSGALSFRLYVHPDMKGLGANYFRISIVAADAQGNPAPGATSKPLSSPVSWRRYVYVNGQVQVQGEGLGPHALVDSNGVVQSGLYLIPYWDNAHQWLHGQFHHSWNTVIEDNGRYLVILEIFDSAGNRLRPIGAPDEGIDTDFDFLRWTDPVNLTPVRYASLMHVFWVDKQPCYADIEDLRLNGMQSTEECQFLTGNAESQFSAGFRAFHANGPSGEPFMWYYTMWYHRGLDGPNRSIQISGENAPPALNVGPPEVSTVQTFLSMLNTHEKCTFALNLRAYAKHTNGHERITGYDRSDQAAFALGIEP